ncbi:MULTISPECIES: type IV pilin protein [Undibacterium]|uniref:Type IV pilin protein n=1 Tax=Undibacterium parvum TaxID=401471 RepID=A0A3S9HGV6_9BURK|nr:MULTISPECIES: type IV pilin protein [Undibacterium]AZP11326.1 type IV pilin protein [Undibacterium parvum]
MYKNRNRGFTLIEIMIAVAILAILGSVAFSSYTDSVIKTRRSEGKTALLKLMQQEEQFFTQNNSYSVFSQASVDANEKKFKWFSGEAASSSSYDIIATACAGDTIQNCVLLTAYPGTTNVNSTFKDPTCGNLTLTSTGVKDVSVSGAKSKCW